MVSIDVSIVSGRRPELLSQTLHSFAKRLFRHFDVAHCFANIDPFAGDDEDRLACIRLVKRYFPQATIFEPAEPNFAKAVSSLWEQALSPYLFHLEDDWLLLEDVTPNRIWPFFVGRTASVRFVSKELGWNGRALFRERLTRVETAAGRLLTTCSSFTLGPAFFARDFVRHCAGLMNPELDPEKQFHERLNPELAEYANRYECRILPGANRPELVKDIGREWRSRRNIEKSVVDGKSIWTTGQSSA